MRTAFISELMIQARQRPEIFLVVGDLGYSVVEPFAEEFPLRFLNAGVAEQNMTGVAAGLASEGYHVFTYSIANFPTLRCLEQIRNDVCYHTLPVTVVAVGGGVAYGNLGYSHHAVEDLAIMRVMPGFRVCAPGDPIEVRLTLAGICNDPKPGYLRLGKAGEPIVHKSVPTWTFGRPIQLHSGHDIAILSTGGALATAIEVREHLLADNIHSTVLSIPVLAPFASDDVFRLIDTAKTVVTIEEHGPGGLSSIVAEAAADLGVALDLVTCRLTGKRSEVVGSQEYIRSAQGMSAGQIASKIRKRLNIIQRS